MRTALITASFVAGLIPTAIFLLYYGLRTKWYETRTGMVLFLMTLTTTISYTISILTLTIPEYFEAEHGEWIRITVRFALAGVSWSLLWLLINAQIVGERRRKREADEQKEKL